MDLNQFNSWFDALTIKRKKRLQIYQEDGIDKALALLENMYGEKVHFVYELLQNADDAGATKVHFELHKDELIFSHNGKRHFNLTDPALEPSPNMVDGSLPIGDINSITKYANSTKTESRNKIGKFGIGFKSVFQYTLSPKIYDLSAEFPVAFEIRDKTVPYRISTSTFDLDKSWTHFIIPFDNPKNSPEVTYKNISEKLRILNYPTLFLSNILQITYSIDGETGFYNKEITETKTFNDIIFEEVKLSKNNGPDDDEIILLFSKLIDNDLRYTVGFGIDSEGHLKSLDAPAYCYFPVISEKTNLDFLIHAPFLLTPARDRIDVSDENNHKINQNNIDLLAKLSTQAFLWMRDMRITQDERIIIEKTMDLLPIRRRSFINTRGTEQISYEIFYSEFLKMFESERIIPSDEGYVSKKHAYWPENISLTKIFDTSRLSALIGDPEAKWVFTNYHYNKQYYYIDEKTEFLLKIVNRYVSEEYLLAGSSEPDDPYLGITSEFIESQKFSENGSENYDWLFSFYSWISKTDRYNFVKTYPIYLDTSGKAVQAYDDKGVLILFLPSTIESSYRRLNEKLLEYEGAIEVFTKIGLKEPDVVDEVYTKILPNYYNPNSTAANNSDKDFKTILSAYLELPHDKISDFATRLDKIYFTWHIIEKNNRCTKQCNITSLVLPIDNLLLFYSILPNYWFIDIDYYANISGELKSKITNFFRDMGAIVKLNINEQEYLTTPDYIQNRGIKWEYSTRLHQWVVHHIIGCEECLNIIIQNKDKGLSIALWNCLLQLLEKYGSGTQLSKQLDTIHQYFFKTQKNESFPSEDQLLLREKEWIVDINGQFVSPNALYIDTISEDYHRSSDLFKDLIVWLNINPKTRKEIEEEQNSNLTDSQKQKLKLSDFANECGLSNEEAMEALRTAADAKKRMAQTLQELPTNPPVIDNKNDSPDNDYSWNKGKSSNNKDIIKKDDSWYESANDNNETHNQKTSDYDKTQPKGSLEIIQNEYYQPRPKSQFIEKLLNKNNPNKSGRRQSIDEIVEKVHKQTFTRKHTQYTPSLEINEDSDYYTRPPVNFSKRIESKEKLFANEIETLARMDYLTKEVESMNPYTYGWFNTLLELESLANEDGKEDKVISIAFTRIEQVSDSDTLYILKYPNRPIPTYIEELSNFKLELYDSKGTLIPVRVEAASVRSFELHIRINKDSNEFNCKTIVNGIIEVCSPRFLFDSLRLRYSELELPLEYNFKDNLPKHIQFIFGPPGTGKTTYLSKNQVLNWLKQSTGGNMLILAPTNKAVDVITNRILSMVTEPEKRARICRFGNTTDQKIIKSGRFIERSQDLSKVTAPIIITTVARFVYDHLLFKGNNVYFCDMPWEYIVIDEASMVSLPQINYILHKSKPTNFYISGDPFQIKPITQIDQWANENIYTMVELKEFNQSMTSLGHEIINLHVQYRSVPAIGNIYGEFTYSNQLQHSRKENDQLDLGLSNKFELSALTLIRFPVQEYESIYRAKTLNKSPYHIYSALFTVEFIQYISNNMKLPAGKIVRIGIISPYGAQANIIDKVLSTVDYPDNIKIIASTVHSFQGDECDIIILVLNTPPHIGNSDRIFVNNHNLLNVAISRARDYLVILAPEDTTYGYGYLRKVKKIEELMVKSPLYREYHSKDLEELLLSDRNFIENNTFSTNHQSVNVYSIPDKKYEIRSEDESVDIQVHKNK